MWLLWTYLIVAGLYLTWRRRYLATHIIHCRVCSAKIIGTRCPVCGHPKETY